MNQCPAVTTPAEVFHTPDIGALTEALIQFHRVCPVIPKDQKGNYGRYADLSTVLEIIQPKLCECGLNVMQMPVGEYGLITILSHTSGEYIGSRYVMKPLEQVIEKATQTKAITPQSVGIVITYQRRYAIAAILNLNIDKDTDADLPKEPEKPKPTAKELMAAGKTATAKPDSSTAEVKSEAASTSVPSTSTVATPTTTTKLINEGGGATKQSDSEPCSEQLADQIKKALTSWEQLTKGVSKDFTTRLHASGRKKIIEFTTGEALQLLASIERKSIVDFFDKQVRPKSA